MHPARGYGPGFSLGESSVRQPTVNGIGIGLHRRGQAIESRGLGAIDDVDGG